MRALIAPAERLIVMHPKVDVSPVYEVATELRPLAKERLRFVVDVGGRIRRPGPDAHTEAHARLTDIRDRRRAAVRTLGALLERARTEK
jgi:hypothetical protein